LKPSTGSFWSDFGPFAVRLRKLDADACAEVLRASEDYLRTIWPGVLGGDPRHAPSASEGVGWIRVGAAAERLGVHPNAVRRLVATGALRGESTSASGRLQRVDAVSVEEETARRRAFMSIPEAIDRLGVTFRQVCDLIAGGLLPRAATPGWEGRTLLRRSADDLMARVAAAIRPPLEGEEPPDVPLPGLPRALGTNLPGVVALVLAGELRGEFRGDALGDLTVTRTSVEEIVSRRRVGRRAAEEWVPLARARRLLGLRAATAALLVEKGILTGRNVAGHVQIAKTAIDAFNTSYLRGAEAAKVLGITKTHVGTLASKGRLRPLVSPETDGIRMLLFARSEVDDFARERQRGARRG
jgi:hypothetical protein